MGGLGRVTRYDKNIKQFNISKAMKKIFMMAASALVLGGCTDGDVASTIKNNEMATVRFAAGTTEMQVRSTRAGETVYTGVIAASNDAGTTWEDKFPLGSLTFEANNLSSTSSALTVKNNDSDVSQIQLTPTDAESFYSLGIANGRLAALTGNIYTINATEKANDIENDYIWDKKEMAIGAGATVTVNFTYQHVMSKLRIELYEEKDGSTIKIEEGAKITNLNGLKLERRGVLDITTGIVTPDTNNTTKLSEINTTGDATGIEYFVIPQTTAADAAFHIDYNNAGYNVPVGSIIFSAGKCRVLKLTLKGSGIDFKATLEEWDDEYTSITIGGQSQNQNQ